MEFVSKQDAEKLSDARKEKISLGRSRVEGFLSLKTENGFEGTNRSLNGGASGIKSVPFVRIADEARIKPQVGIRINVNAAPVGGVGAGRIAEAASGGTRFCLDDLGFRANEFEAFGTVFAGTRAIEKQRRFVLGTERYTILAQFCGYGSLSRLSTGISG